MAKKKSKQKKSKKKMAKKEIKKPESAFLNLKLLRKDLAEAQRELNQIQKRIGKLAALCQRPRVVKHK